MANMSAIYQYLGAKESELAVLWLAAPLTGLLVQPIIATRATAPGSARAASALFPDRRDPGQPGADRHAEFGHGLDGGRSIVDSRCECERHDGAVPRIRGRPPADGAAQERFRHAEPAYRPGRGAFLGAALHATNGFGVSNEATVKSPIPPAVALASISGRRCFSSLCSIRF